MEGARVEELSAIQMHASTLQILDVFHGFAKSTCSDDWARKHIHGLNKNFLDGHAVHNNEAELLNSFTVWLRGKNVLEIFANDPNKERSVFGERYAIYDFRLPIWEHRDHCAPHEMALQYKKKWAAVLNQRCCAEAHSSFWKVPMYRRNAKEVAKERWGVHCSLYDCLEMFFFYIYS